MGFTSEAANLVPGDTNGFWDAFVRDRTCGNGTPEGAEECDDGRNDDGDGCDANCTLTRCGNGRPTAGEACDDGGTNGTDQCCTSDCQLVDGDGDGVCDAFDPCTGAAIEDGRLLLSGFSGQFTRTPRLSFKGHVTLSAPFDPPLDPLANGVRLLIADAVALPLLDVTIPGGPLAGSPAMGWTANSSGTKWRYKNTDPRRFPDAVTRIQVQDQSAATPGRVRFTMRGELSLDAFRGARLPIKMFLFLHPPDDSMGECGEARPACVTTSLGDRLSCR